MQKSISLIIFIFVCFFILSFSAKAVDISAKGAVLLEADSTSIAFGKNENTPLPMASTTKIMTALVVLENSCLDHIVTIEPSMVGIEGSSIYLQVGEALTVEELLYALLLESANDASVALAIHVSGSVESFAELMNEKAQALGLKSTHFTNPHGLDDKEHYTTPYELGIIAANAMKNEKFKEIVSTRKKTIPLNNGDGTRVLVNHNRLLRLYDGTIGIKTGFTKKSGRCLVSASSRNGVTLICVTLNAPNDWQDHISLLNYGFDNYESVLLAEPNSYSIELPVIGGDKSTLNAENTQGLSVTLNKENINISAIVESNRLLSAPISKGDLVGNIVFYNNDKIIATLPLFAKENVKVQNYKKSIFERIFK